MKHLYALFTALLAAIGVHAGEVQVAAAANSTEPAKQIAAEFTRDTGHLAKLSFGSTGKFYTQITTGAPFEMLLAADPDTFALHPHYANYRFILVNAGRIGPDWARPRLIAQWRALAPKRWLRDWDAQQG